jgi:hypothetical protein
VLKVGMIICQFGHQVHVCGAKHWSPMQPAMMKISTWCGKSCWIKYPDTGILRRYSSNFTSPAGNGINLGKIIAAIRLHHWPRYHGCRSCGFCALTGVTAYLAIISCFCWLCFQGWRCLFKAAQGEWWQLLTGSCSIFQAAWVIFCTLGV